MGAHIEIVGDEYDLELAVLRESIAAIDVGRSRCTTCGRTPLVGEYVFRSQGSQVDCEPCRRKLPSAPPAVIEQVRNGGGHLTVQTREPAQPRWSHEVA